MNFKSEQSSFPNIRRKLSILNFTFSIILIFDILLGVKISREEINYKPYYKQQTGTVRNRSTRIVIGIITDQNEYPLRKKQLYNTSKEGDEILIYKTKIFEEVTKIKHNDIDYDDSAYSIYAFYYLFPFLCLIISMGTFIMDKFKSPYYNFSVILSTILTIYLLISMITNNIV